MTLPLLFSKLQICFRITNIGVMTKAVQEKKIFCQTLWCEELQKSVFLGQ